MWAKRFAQGISHAEPDQPSCRIQTPRNGRHARIAGRRWIPHPAYVQASDTIDRLEKPVEKIFAEGGLEALDALPGIGRGIASAIKEMLSTGHWSQLERLRGELEPELLFRTLPGVGPELAAKIHDLLDVDTLEALEVAAHDGRLETVPGVGPRRATAIRIALNERLGHRRVRMTAIAPDHHHVAPVAMLLAVDREYRAKTDAGTLRKIAPKRFNPTAEGVVAGPAHPSRRLGVHRSVFQYQDRPRSR